MRAAPSEKESAFGGLGFVAARYRLTITSRK